MIVEGQGIGFWTRVRLPSSPLDYVKSNPMFDIVIYKNIFALVKKLMYNIYVRLRK